MKSYINEHAIRIGLWEPLWDGINAEVNNQVDTSIKMTAYLMTANFIQRLNQNLIHNSIGKFLSEYNFNN